MGLVEFSCNEAASWRLWIFKFNTKNHIQNKYFVTAQSPCFCAWGILVTGSNYLQRLSPWEVSHMTFDWIESTALTALGWLVVNMSVDFYRFYVGFLLVFTSFSIDSSFSSFLRALVKDPVGIELCKRSCHGRNTTTSCNKHMLNETTSGRCCINKGSVVG